MTCGIYKVTSPSGRVYIGQSVNIENRFKEYRTVSGCCKQRRLYASFKKYGPKQHLLEVVEQCKEDSLLERERYWQDFYNVLSENGLNCRLTGYKDKVGRHSQDSIAKMRIAQGGKNNPNYGKRGEQTSTFGRKRTKDERDAIKAYQQTRGRLVCQLNANTGELLLKTKVKNFVEMGFSQGNISSCCNGRLKTHKGYKFEYEAQP